MISRLILQATAIAAAGLTACAAFKSGKPDKPTQKTAPEAPKLVGVIASIPADKRFVLIQSYGPWDIEAGTILTTRGPDERTANLLVTGESLGQFAAADLQSGIADVGDAVYSRHVPKPPQVSPTLEKAPESAEMPPEATSRNVQKNN